MNFRLYLMSVLLASAVAITAFPDVMVYSCEPDCSGSSPLGKVEDPSNCTQYYFCLPDLTPSDHPVPCPDGSSFPPDGTDCTGTIPCDASCGSGGDGGACHLTCNGTGDIISDASDCGIFYDCDAAGPKPGRTCPPDLPYFDGKDCVNDDSVCCVPSCDPVCEAALSIIPDPKDCHRYYICIEAGTVPDEIYHFTCESGETFDIGIGMCTATAECKILCTDPSIITTPVSSIKPTTKAVSSMPNATDVSGMPNATTTSGASTITPGSSTTFSGCLESVTCDSDGFVAKCTTCVSEYFSCGAAGAAGVEKECAEGLVFNPVPEYPYCILPSNCPYTPGPSTTVSGCLGSVTCDSVDSVAKCDTCVPEYFSCSAAGAAGVEKECTGGKVFNTVPEYPYCILPSNCPYTGPP